ncbi:MAG: hypothetical protein JWO05_92 [Gemmatimonadetes bacterium]|nr:hypothetical protein [Gemmatimonadota bacterium]
MVPAPPPEGASRLSHLRHRVRRLPTLAALVAALVFMAALALQGWRAERDQRRTATTALSEYAGVAAWEFASSAKEEIYLSISELMRPVSDLGPADLSHLPAPTMLIDANDEVKRCNCAFVLPAAYYFRVDLRNGAVAIAGDSAPDAAERQWLVDSLRHHVAQYAKMNFRAVAFVGKVGWQHRAVAYSVVRDTANTPVIAYGLVNSPEAFGQAIFPQVMREWPLLPPSITGKLRSDSMVSIRVTDDEGHVVYASQKQYKSAYRSSYQIQQRFLSALTVEATLKPDVANQLLVGAAAPSRVPMILGLLALTLALIVVAFRQLRREAALARMRADFVSSVSHELRTPLAQIRMFAELLRMGWIRNEEERQRSLEIVDQEARRLSHLVDTVLAFERGERGKVPLRVETVALAPLLMEVRDAFAPLARARRVTLTLQLDERVGAMVDAGALRQVLINLLDNAVKYGPDGQDVRITLTGGDRARVAVEDEGPGIPASERERVWEPFRRLPRDANSSVAGSGIGLAVVRELIERQEGVVRIESSPAGGARFVIELPPAVVVTSPARAESRVEGTSPAPSLLPSH